jgi:uncharacterized membrane protein (UPF0127 family)
VKQINLFALVLLAACWAGCQKNAANSPIGANTNSAIATPTPTNTEAETGGYVLPTGPQPKLQTLKIYLGPETLDAEMALTPMQEATGLMYRTNITDETAMLFVLPIPMRAPDGFWMTNCPISLSAAYIGPDGVIEEIHHLEKNDNTPVIATNDNIIYVLEVNDGWFTRHNINTGTMIRTERGALTDTFTRK